MTKQLCLPEILKMQKMAINFAEQYQKYYIIS
jgi:hypothetical protein